MTFAIDADDVPIDSGNVTLPGEGIWRDWRFRRVEGSWDVTRPVVDDERS